MRRFDTTDFGDVKLSGRAVRQSDGTVTLNVKWTWLRANSFPAHGDMILVTCQTERWDVVKLINNKPEFFADLNTAQDEEGYITALTLTNTLVGYAQVSPNGNGDVTFVLTPRDGIPDETTFTVIHLQPKVYPAPSEPSLGYHHTLQQRFYEMMGGTAKLTILPKGIQVQLPK